MAWAAEVTDEFEAWWNALDEQEQVSVDGMIRVLEVHGPTLGPPYSTQIDGSQYPQLKQLRVPHESRRLFCIYYVVDDGRSTVVLLSGSRSETNDCPAEQVPVVDRVYTRYLSRREELD